MWRSWTKILTAAFMVTLFASQWRHAWWRRSEQHTLQPVSYDPNLPDYLPKLTTPADNPLTVDGINLGRHLFWQYIIRQRHHELCFLSWPQKAFTDGNAVSVSIDGISGKRSSMSLVNAGLPKTAFWDGRKPATLEDQALLPGYWSHRIAHHLDRCWKTGCAAMLLSHPFPAFGYKNKARSARLWQLRLLLNTMNHSKCRQ